VRFVEANLYSASFISARGEGADFNRANLKKSTLERGA